MANELLWEVIQYSLKSSLSATSHDHNSPPQGDSPRQKLIDGLLFSRRLILTYHLVILCIVLVLSISHWSQKAIRWSNRRGAHRRPQIIKDHSLGDENPLKGTLWRGHEDIQIPGEASSSGSSTLLDSTSPSRKNVNESTPLLIRGFLVPTRQRTVVSMVKAFLIYQPAPIPFINKALPSNGVSIVILCFLGLNIFYLLFNLEFNSGYIFVIAERFGLVFVANLPLLYLLVAKNQPLKILTGRSYESLNIFHRRLGELLCLEAFFHGVGMTVVWWILLRPRGFSFSQYLLLPVIYLGLGAFLAYEILYFTSLGSFRQRWYEVFLGLHIFLQIAALVFVYFHHRTTQPYVGAALAIFLIDRFIYRLGIKNTVITAKAKLMEDEETVKLTMTAPSQTNFTMSKLFGKSLTSGWDPTDHVFVSIPTLGRQHMFQAHPFTIASAAPTSEDEAKTLELLIRSQSGFSQDLLHYVHRHNTLNVRLDGPYGSSHARDLLEDSDLALVVAGGSGIAVAWPLIEHLIHLSGNSSNTDTETGTYFPTSIYCRKKVVLIWIVHQAAHHSWLSSVDMEVARSKGIEIVIPTATEDAGRPKLRGMIEGFVDRYENGLELGDNNESTNINRGKRRMRTRIVASGPDGMGRLVRNTAARLVWKGRDVDVTIEKFGW